MAEFECALKYSARSQSNKSPTLISRKFDSQDCPSSSHPTGLGARRLFWPIVEEGAIGLQGEKLSCSTLVHVNNTTVNATKIIHLLWILDWWGIQSELLCIVNLEVFQDNVVLQTIILSVIISQQGNSTGRAMTRGHETDSKMWKEDVNFSLHCWRNKTSTATRSHAVLGQGR